MLAMARITTLMLAKLRNTVLVHSYGTHAVRAHHLCCYGMLLAFLVTDAVRACHEGCYVSCSLLGMSWLSLAYTVSVICV